MKIDRLEQIRQAAEFYCNNDAKRELGFIEGAKWADTHPVIWHDVSEVPQDKSHILIRYTFTGTIEFKSYNIDYQCDFTWSELINLYEIEGWAYISDLLSKGDEK